MHIFTVGELSRALTETLEAEFPFVWVRGQVGQCSATSRGHIFFSLKDESALLEAVWFRSSRELGEGGVHPLTGEVVEQGAPELREGMAVLVAGRLTHWGPRGRTQLVAELVQEEGVGRLHLAFEQLKATLAAAGYFAQERKRAMPPRPCRVALITAPGGAAVRDFLAIAAERGANCSFRIHAVRVQGAGAEAELARALREVAEQGWAQAAVLLRGGGSLEDLWAFNTRELADAVLACPVPVVSGVGHEVDVTICDLVADLRAATPSHAAQLLFTDRAELLRRLESLERGLAAAGVRMLAGREAELASLRRGLGWFSPGRRVLREAERAAELDRRLRRAGTELLAREARRLEGLARRLGAAFGPREVSARSQALELLSGRLARAGGQLVQHQEQRLDVLAARLEALDPAGPLARGYALVEVRRTGRYLRHPGEVTPGDDLAIQVAGGTVAARVRDAAAPTDSVAPATPAADASSSPPPNQDDQDHRE